MATVRARQHYHPRHQPQSLVTVRQWFEARIAESGIVSDSQRPVWHDVFAQRVDSSPPVLAPLKANTTVGQWRRRLPDYVFLLLYSEQAADDGGAETNILIHGVVLLAASDDPLSLLATLTMLPPQCFAPTTSRALVLREMLERVDRHNDQAEGWAYVDLMRFDAIAAAKVMTWMAHGDEWFRPFASSSDSTTAGLVLDGHCCQALIECYAALFELLARVTPATNFYYRGTEATAAAAATTMPLPDTSLDADMRAFLEQAKKIVRMHYLMMKQEPNAPRTLLRFCSERERAADIKARMAAFLFVRSVRDEYTRHVLTRVERLFLCAFISEAWPRQDMIERLLAQNDEYRLAYFCYLPLAANVMGSFDHDWWRKPLALHASEWTKAFQQADELLDDDSGDSSSSNEWQRRRKNERQQTDSAAVQRYAHVVLLPPNPPRQSTIVDTYFERTLNTATTRYRNFMLPNMDERLTRFACFEQARDAYLLQAHTHVLLFDEATQMFIVTPRHSVDERFTFVADGMVSQVMLGHNVPVHPVLAVEALSVADDSASVEALLCTLSSQLATLLGDASSWGCFFSMPASANAIALNSPQVLGARAVRLRTGLYAVSFANVVLPNVEALAALARAWLVRFALPAVPMGPPAPKEADATVVVATPKNGKRPHPTSSASAATIVVKPITVAVRGQIRLADDASSLTTTTALMSVLSAQGALWPLSPTLMPLHPCPSAATMERLVWPRLEWHFYTTNNDVMGHASKSVAVASLAGAPAATAAKRSTAAELPPDPMSSVIVDPERRQWHYRQSALQRATLLRLQEFHRDAASSQQQHSAPEWMLLVDRTPFDECDPHFAQRPYNAVLARHAVLCYRDVPRWLGALHWFYAMHVDLNIAQSSSAHGDAATFVRSLGSQAMFDLYVLATRVFQPLLLRTQSVTEEIIAEQKQSALTTAATAMGRREDASLQLERRARISAAYAAVDSMLLDNATAYLPWLLDEPGVLLSRGTNYRFRKGGSLSVQVGATDEKRGMWKDFQSGEGGRGLVRLTHYVRFQGQKNVPMGKAYELARQWLASHRDELKQFDDKAFLMLYASSGAGVLGPEDVERIQRYSATLAAGDHVMSYLCATRGLGGLITRRLLEWWHEHDLVRTEARSRYYTGEGEYFDTPAMLLWFYDSQWRRGRLQRNYLQVKLDDVTQRRVVSKLRVADAKREGEFLAAKKYRVVNEEVAPHAFLWLQRGERDDAPLVLAEGFETALSVAVSLPGVHVFVAGGVSYCKHFDWRAALPDARVVVLCRDNDTGRARENTDKAARATVESLSSIGYQVHEVFPTDESRYNDFNDVHQAQPGRAGSSLVAEMLCSQLPLLRQFVEPSLALITTADTSSSPTTTVETASNMEVDATTQ